jgi:hypothetical protein
MTQHIKKQEEALNQHLEELKQQFDVKQQEKNEELQQLKDTKLVTKMRDYEVLKLKKLVSQKFWFNTPDSWEAFKSSAYQHSLAEEQLKNLYTNQSASMMNMTEETKKIFSDHVLEWFDEFTAKNTVVDQHLFIEIVFDDGSVKYYNLAKNIDLLRRIFANKEFLYQYEDEIYGRGTSDQDIAIAFKSMTSFRLVESDMIIPDDFPSSAKKTHMHPLAKTKPYNH